VQSGAAIHTAMNYFFLNLQSNQMTAEGKFFPKQTALDIFTGNKERVCKRILPALFISEM
jgi:hypothetical protein